MSGPVLTRDDDGAVIFDELAPWFVSVLLELPHLLGPDQPDAVRERLFPHPVDGEEDRADWKKYVHPELFALLASAREIVLTDVRGLSPADDADGLDLWRMRVPREHVNGWISALNAGRLALGARYEVDEDAMSEERLEEPEDWSEQRVAVAKIHLLGWLQQMILEAEHPPPEEEPLA